MVCWSWSVSVCRYLLAGLGISWSVGPGSVSVCRYLLAGLGISWSVGPGVSVSVFIYSQVWECHGLSVRKCQCLYLSTRRSGNIMVCWSWSVSVCRYLLAGLVVSWSVGPGVSVSVGIYSQVWEYHGLLVLECQCLYLSTRRSGNIMVCWSGSVSVCRYLLAGLGVSWSVGPGVSVSVGIYSQVWDHHGLLVRECQCL